MQHPLPDLGEWPALEWEQWKDTAETLHMYMQIVGKTRLGLTPIQNHWWNVAFYLTARGLTTSAMPADGGMLLDIEFDFVSHELVCRTSRGEVRKIPLRPTSVAQFFEEFMQDAGLSRSVRQDRPDAGGDRKSHPLRSRFGALQLRRRGGCAVLECAQDQLTRFSSVSPRTFMARSARSTSSGDRSIWR